MKKRLLSWILSLAVAGAMLSQIAMSVSAASTYCINGVNIHYTNYSSSPSRCWTYANNFYKKIWGKNFNNKFDDSDNSLRNLSDSELTLTLEHLKTYVTNSALGSCLRICDSEYLHGNDGWGHSQIIVQKDSNGFTVFEGGLSASPYCREKYYTWSEYINTSWLGGSYEYIKYIKWPSAPAYIPCDHTYKGCGVCSKCGYVYDWKSTFDASAMGEYKLLKQDYDPRTDQPYDDGTHANICMMPGVTVTVLGSYTNAYGNVWYEFKLGNKTYFGYSPYFQLVKYLDLDVSCTNFSPANNSVLEKKSYPVIGTVTSYNYPLKAIDAYLDGEKFATWTASNKTTKTVELRSTAINTNLKFSGLATGKHTIVLKAWDYVHSTAVEFHRSIFYTESAACSHSYSSRVTQAATCTATGIRVYTCSKCGDRYSASIPATGHSYTGKVTAPTCTTQGYTTYTCSCGYSYKDSYTAATGHSYTNKITAPTCTAQGYTTHSCFRCGHSYKDSYAAATGHSYSYKATTAPTTGATGKLTGTCSKCFGTTTVTLPKLSTTDYSYSVIKEPSHTATGTGRYTWNTKTYGMFYFDVMLDKYAYPLGDLNADMAVTSDDVVQLLLHVSMPDVFPLDAEADFTGDGKVTSDDVVQLLLHVSMPDMFPLQSVKKKS